MKAFAKNVWFGFWTAGEIFFRWISIGFAVLSDLCGTIADIPSRRD